MKQFILTTLASALFSHTLWAAEINLPTIEAEITHAPQAPAPLNHNYEAKVVVKMKVEEKVMPLADGVDYKYWTFDGDVPARMIRVREGDVVEVQLSNPQSSTMSHNLDFHAATGTGGGSSASLT